MLEDAMSYIVFVLTMSFNKRNPNYALYCLHLNFREVHIIPLYEHSQGNIS